MTCRRGVAFCVCVVVLTLTWAPVAFIVNTGVDNTRRRVASIVELRSEGGAVLPAFRLEATGFLDPRLAPSLPPGPVERAGSAPDAARNEVVASPRNARLAEWSSTLSERPYAHLVLQAAERHGVDPGLVHALIEVESGYRPDAISTAGAMGLMQLMPATVKRYGVADPLDPAANIDAGTRYLRALLDEFGPLYGLNALAAYNAGESVVRRHGGIPPYPQTRTFVRRVMDVLLSQTGWGGGR